MATFANNASSKMTAIGVLGGTFDPIHKAHIACAHCARTLLALDKVKLIPCANTPHRNQPQRSAAHRCNMVALAIQNETGLELDKRECEREGLSYTVDTLQSLRDELNQHDVLVFILGSDAFAHILSWHHYEKILALCHLLVIQRPNHSFPNNVALKNFIEQFESKSIEELKTTAAGKIYFYEELNLDISSTRIRSDVDTALSNDLPEEVKTYIHEHRLYRE